VVWKLNHSLWQAAYRPLFLCAGLWALVAPAVWLWPGGSGVDPVRWHLEGLFFGMGGAAVGGYLLTALPGWTNGRPVGPQVVRTLTLLWALARLAVPCAGVLPVAVLLGLSLGYFAALALVLTRQIVGARVWSRLWTVGAIAGLALGDAIVLADLFGWADAAPLAMVWLFALLISAIGGRAVPAFTRRWLETSGSRPALRTSGLTADLALTATALGGGLALVGQGAAAGLCLLLAGAVQGLRLAGWQSWQTRLYPALALLHLAWAWVPVGLILLGLGMLLPEVMPVTTALHALTMGAMGTMIIAIAGRAAMRRRGNRLVLGRGLGLAFAMVWAAAVLRVLGLIPLSAGLWMLGWAVFLLAFGPALHGPVPWPVLSPPPTKPPSDR